MKYIEDKLFSNIIEVIPLVCVDAFIIDDYGRILLMKRNQSPVQGQWWVPGGRVLKNESLIDAVIRKVKEETNLDVVFAADMGFTETMFENKHTVNICFLLMPITMDLKLNSEHSEYKWFEFTNLPEDLHPVLLDKINKL